MKEIKLFFLVLLERTHEGSLSWGVWNLPWPNLEEVSMNLRLIFSNAFLLVWTRRDFLRVRTRFLGPMQHPLMLLSARSYSVLALFLINLPSFILNPSPIL